MSGNLIGFGEEIKILVFKNARYLEPCIFLSFLLIKARTNVRKSRALD